MLLHIADSKARITPTYREREVTAADVAILRTRLNSAPGPSGFSWAGTVPRP